jgi:DNA-binding response OmpR family regulator
MSAITLGNLIVDRGRVAASIAGRPLDLTYVEFELLHTLARNAGHVMSRQKLMRSVWRESGSGGDRKLTVHMSRLRTKMRGSDPWRIQTYTRRGYGLMDRSLSEMSVAAGIPEGSKA